MTFALPHYAPQVFMAIAALCLIAAIRRLIRERRILEMVPASNFMIQLPAKWDDSEITNLLRRYGDQPTVLSYAVSSIKTRMILNQDLKTARRRLQLIGRVIEVFKLNRELQGVLHDIQLADKEFEIQQVESQIRKEDADSRLKSERQLRELRKQREELQLKKEIATLQQDINKTNEAAAPEPKISPDQQRRLKRMDIEDRIRELDRLEEEAVKNARSDEDRARIQNMHADKREELQQQLARYLV